MLGEIIDFGKVKTLKWKLIVGYPIRWRGTCKLTLFCEYEFSFTL